jgi:hypothetical protein
MIGLLKRLFCSIPDPSLPYAAAATSLTSPLMYQANPICARPCVNYFPGDGSCTRNAAVGNWPLAKAIRIVAASLDFLMAAMLAVSCDPGDSSTPPRAAGPTQSEAERRIANVEDIADLDDSLHNHYAPLNLLGETKGYLASLLPLPMKFTNFSSKCVNLGFKFLVIQCVALPNHKISPAPARDLAPVNFISFDVARDFRVPIIDVRFRTSADSTVAMVVPKAPVNPDNGPVFGENYIWLPRYFAAMQPKTKPHSVKS